MNQKSMSKRMKSAGDTAAIVRAMSAEDLANLGGGVVAYIKTMTADEAKRMFPAVEGLPQGISLYSLHAADGTPIALTDTLQAAVGHAIGDELEVQSLH